MLSFEDRLLQLERWERWCRKATTWQQFRVILPIALFLGTAAGLSARLTPCPTPDNVCEITTHQIKIQVGASLLLADFSVCPGTEQEGVPRSAGFYPMRERAESSAHPNFRATRLGHRFLGSTAIHFLLMRERPDTLDL